jgi:hypothetical protein
LKPFHIGAVIGMLVVQLLLPLLNGGRNNQPSLEKVKAGGGW